MLGFFGIGKQAVNIGSECSLGVWNYSIWRGVAHVLIVVAPAIAIGAVQVDKPSPIEVPAMPPWHERTEIFNRRLQGGENGLEFPVNGVSVTRPIFRLGIEADKYVENSRAECIASVSATSLVTVAPSKVSTKAGNKKPANDAGLVSKDDVDQFLQGALLAMLIAWPIIFLGDAGPYGGMKKPNGRELSGAAELPRS